MWRILIEKYNLKKAAFVLFVLLALFVFQFYSGRPLLKSTKGTVSFFSEAPLENIDATSNNVVSLINTSTNEIAFDIAIKSFHFKKAKMETDFNENFMESAQYPTAVYKGKINEKIDWRKDGTFQVTSNGALAIHGITRERRDTATLKIKNGVVDLASKFSVRIADHQIKVPTLLYKHIAEVVEVKLSVNYSPNDEKQVIASKN
jgi:hypothetical protein